SLSVNDVLVERLQLAPPLIAGREFSTQPRSQTTFGIQLHNGSPPGALFDHDKLARMVNLRQQDSKIQRSLNVFT
ncbi:MAG: hypothetical protein ACR2PZ_19105, partial [Pseudomonadales bacterium]